MDATEAVDGLSKARLRIGVGAGRLSVRAAPLGDQLFRAHLDFAGSQPEVRLDRADGTVNITQRTDWIGSPWGRFELDLQLNQALPWQLDCETGAIRGTLDLSALPLTGFKLATGASRIELDVPRPQGEVPINIAGGALRVRLSRPAGTAVHARIEGGAIHFQADGASQDGIGSREWRSAGSESAADRYEIKVTGGATRVELEQRP
jgi:hypothetical protein